MLFNVNNILVVDKPLIINSDAAVKATHALTTWSSRKFVPTFQEKASVDFIYKLLSKGSWSELLASQYTPAYIDSFLCIPALYAIMYHKGGGYKASTLLYFLL
jgi:hypothetical protein